MYLWWRWSSTCAHCDVFTNQSRLGITQNGYFMCHIHVYFIAYLVFINSIISSDNSVELWCPWVSFLCIVNGSSQMEHFHSFIWIWTPTLKYNNFATVDKSEWKYLLWKCLAPVPSLSVNLRKTDYLWLNKLFQLYNYGYSHVIIKMSKLFRFLARLSFSHKVIFVYTSIFKYIIYWTH